MKFESREEGGCMMRYDMIRRVKLVDDQPANRWTDVSFTRPVPGDRSKVFRPIQCAGEITIASPCRFDSGFEVSKGAPAGVDLALEFD